MASIHASKRHVYLTYVPVPGRALSSVHIASKLLFVFLFLLCLSSLLLFALFALSPLSSLAIL